MQLAIKKRLKFIYRPSAVKGLPEENADKLVWKKIGNQIQVTNPTPFYMNFSVITVGGKTFKPTLPEQAPVAQQQNGYLPFLQEQSVTLLAGK